MAIAGVSTLATRLRAVVGAEGVIDSPADRLVYERDASFFERGLPDLIVLPRDTRQVAEVVGLCAEQGVGIVPRGAGTGLVGGCVTRGGVVVATTRLREVVEINARNRFALVESGVTPATLNARLLHTGLMFAPDPLSGAACTVGGCIATNARGPRSLKYGDTHAHILGAEVVLRDGQIVQLGGSREGCPGPELLGMIVGCEGATGIITRAWLRLARHPASRHVLLALFATAAAAWETSQELLAADIGLSALEWLDRLVLDGLVRAAGVRLPKTTQVALLCEIDGAEPTVRESRERLAEIGSKGGALELRNAGNPRDQAALWMWRARAVAALRGLAPACWVQDVTVPRWQMAAAMTQFASMADAHGLRVAQIAHIGTGCLHPVLLFDDRNEAEASRAVAVRDAILDYCLSNGGVASGEFGVGREKASFAARVDSAEVRHAQAHLQAVFGQAGPSSVSRDLSPSRDACAEQPDSREVGPPELVQSEEES
jgi:glycolate oxidase